MKRKNTLWSLVLALVMVLGVFAPLGTLAKENPSFPQGTETPADLKVTLEEKDFQGTKPEKTPVTVHKLQADKYADGIGIGFKHNGGKIPVNEGKYPDALGTNVKELDGVTFTYYKLKDAAQLKDFIANKATLTTTAAVEAKGLTQAGTLKTAGGAGATVELEDGYYWFVESKYDKPEGGPDITSSIAVPFWLSIPVMNKEKVGKYDIGTAYLKEVHVYPKNVTGKDSVPSKTVANEVNMNAKYDIGQTNTWYLQATIPANIQDYETFKMVDTFFKGLTYKGNVEVYMGYDGAKDAGKHVELVKGQDYTLTEPAVDTKFTTEMPSEADFPNFDPSAKPDFTVTLTEKGLKKLVDNYQTVKTNADGKDVKLYAKVDTVINEDAKIGTKIKNTYDLITKIKGKDEKKKKPDNPPSVETGGKKFIKVSESEPNKVLEDAVFALYDEVKKPKAKEAEQLKWTADLITANEAAIKAGNFATKADNTDNYTATSDANMPTAGTPIYLRSNAQGLFEIKGLEYSKWTKTLVDNTTEEHEHNYYLMEVKFPENYAGNKDTKFAFTIDEKSYDGTATEYPGEKLKDGAMMVENKDLTIPPTGGMGTVIFVVAGMALMGGAFIAMRKRSAEQA